MIHIQEVKFPRIMDYYLPAIQFKVEIRLGIANAIMK